MQTVVTILTCDLTGERDDIRTVPFTYNGIAYEIELCPQALKELDTFLERYIEHARATDSKPVPEPPVARPLIPEPRDKRDRQRSRDIRVWAASQGINLNGFGKIPRQVVERYDREQVTTC